ncbi:MAG: inositol monophosphatase family protein [Candidatus Bathyarchaeia archaeon]|jgi:myo-inositol-1(or 4)-monophosphatase
MREPADWAHVLNQCKNNIQLKIKPLLKTLNQPQPNLGTGAGGDPVKKVDLAAENAIVSTLREQKITFTLISEESGIVEYGESPRRCYVTADPIDGTTNLMRGAPFYATSIAVSTEPTLTKVHTALVTDLFHGTTYTAQKGCGAYKDDRKITPSTRASMEEAVIGIDLNSYRIQKIAPRLTKLLGKTKHLRHFGANALELCYVADGTIDAFIDIRGKLRTTDMAAAWLIIEEAGAIITTPLGKPLHVKLDPKQKVEFIAAANQEVHRRILSLTKPEKEKT